MALTCRGLDGKMLAVRFNPVESGDDQSARIAAATLDGQPLAFPPTPVYDGPYVRQENSILSVNDGRSGFIVDMSGELPAYKPWKASN